MFGGVLQLIPTWCLICLQDQAHLELARLRSEHTETIQKLIQSHTEEVVQIKREHSDAMRAAEGGLQVISSVYFSVEMPLCCGFVCFALCFAAGCRV